jgi:hypothetical protein
MPISHEMFSRITRQYFDHNGGLTPHARFQMAPHIEPFIAELKRQFPMSDETLRAVRDYFLGRGSRQLVLKLIIDSTSDPAVFLGWYAKDWDGVSPVTAWIRNEGSNVVKAIAAARRQAEGIFEAQRGAGLTDQQIHAQARKALEHLPIAIVRRICGQDQQGKERDLSYEEALRFTPGCATVAHVLVETMMRTVGVPTSPRKNKLSDYGDALHSMYLPYVDIFRADAFTAEVIKSLSLPFATKVVDNLADLPSAIEDALGSLVQ